MIKFHSFEYLNRIEQYLGIYNYTHVYYSLKNYIYYNITNIRAELSVCDLNIYQNKIEI